MTDFPPLSPEQQEQLNQLNHQQAMADWQTQEGARLARLALLAPLDGAVDFQLLLDRIEEIEAASPGSDIKDRAYRVRTILSTDLKWLMDELVRANTPAPQPVLQPSEPEGLAR